MDKDQRFGVALIVVMLLFLAWLGWNSLFHDRERLRILSEGRCEQVIGLRDGGYEKVWARC